MSILYFQYSVFHFPLIINLNNFPIKLYAKHKNSPLSLNNKNSKFFTKLVASPLKVFSIWSEMP